MLDCIQIASLKKLQVNTFSIQEVLGHCKNDNKNYILRIAHNNHVRSRKWLIITADQDRM